MTIGQAQDFSISVETLQFLKWLLSQQQISVAAPDAREAAARIFLAMDEVEQVLSARIETPPIAAAFQD